MLEKVKGKYVCGGKDDLEKLPFPVLVKEKDGKTWDWFKCSEDVCKFFKELRTKKILRVNDGKNYEKFISGVETLCKKNNPGASLKEPKGFLFQHGKLDELINLCKTYVKEGTDEDRKKKIKGFKIILKKAKADAVKDITDAGMNSGRTFKQDLNAEAYNKIEIDGELAKQFQTGNDDYKFQDNDHLKEVTISPAVEKVLMGAFKNCKKLKKIVIPRRQKELVFDTKSIDGCANLKEIVTSGNAKDKVVFKKNAIENSGKYKLVGEATFEQ